MGIEIDAPAWTPVLATLVVVLGAVGLALTRCAVSELVLRIAVRLYSDDANVRIRVREEWLRILMDMKPAERPAHSGSLLWLGVRSRALRVQPWSLRRAVAEILNGIRAARTARANASCYPLDDLESAMVEHFVAGESTTESARAFGMRESVFTSRLTDALEALERAGLSHLGRPKHDKHTEPAPGGTDG